MNPKFLEILQCPRTGKALRLRADETLPDGTVKTGRLVTEDGENQYPIIDFIPRFVDKEHYTSSFGFEWQKWSRVQFEAENVGGKMDGHTTKMFDMIAGFAEEDLKGKLVVEFGCGPGRFLDIVRKRGGVAVGIDMSIAVDAARKNFHADPDVLIVQGDILDPPFRKGVFDAGYSMGVLHHTPDPGRGFCNLVGVLKENAPVACSVYPDKGFYAFPSVGRYRRLHNATKKRFGNRLALGYAYFSAYFLHPVLAVCRKVPLLKQMARHGEKYWFVCLDLPDPRWRLLDVFDAITPFYASTHSSGEVRSWFVRANCREIRQSPWGPTSYRGVTGRR